MQNLILKMTLTQMMMRKKKKENSILIQMKYKAKILIQNLQKMIVNHQMNYQRKYYQKQKNYNQNRKFRRSKW